MAIHNSQDFHAFAALVRPTASPPFLAAANVASMKLSRSSSCLPHAACSLGGAGPPAGSLVDTTVETGDAPSCSWDSTEAGSAIGPGIQNPEHRLQDLPSRDRFTARQLSGMCSWEK